MSKRGQQNVINVAVLLFAWAIPIAAAAQSDAPPPIHEVRENAPFHLGPLYAKPILELKELGIDNNVYNTYGDRQLSDFTFTFTPKATLSLPIAKRALLQATPAADLVWYAKYAGERSVDPQLQLSGQVFLRRLTFFGEGSHVNTRQRPNQEIDVRARHIDQTLTAGVEMAITPEVTIKVAGHQLSTTYEDAAEYDNTKLQRTLNRDTDGLEIKTSYRLTALTSLAVRYDTFRDRFPLSPSRDSDSFKVLPGVEFKPRALISGNAYVGYRAFTPLDRTALPDFRGLVAQLGLSYTLLGATTFGVSYNRDLTYSYEELQPFFIDNSVGASVRRALGRRFDVLVSADRHAYEYTDRMSSGSTPVADDPRIDPTRIDTTWNYAGSLGYRLLREGRIGFGVSYWRRDSTTRVFRAYDNLRIGTTMTIGF